MMFDSILEEREKQQESVRCRCSLSSVRLPTIGAAGVSQPNGINLIDRQADHRRLPASSLCIADDLRSRSASFRRSGLRDARNRRNN